MFIYFFFSFLFTLQGISKRKEEEEEAEQGYENKEACKLEKWWYSIKRRRNQKKTVKDTAGRLKKKKAKVPLISTELRHCNEERKKKSKAFYASV